MMDMNVSMWLLIALLGTAQHLTLWVPGVIENACPRMCAPRPGRDYSVDNVSTDTAKPTTLELGRVTVVNRSVFIAVGREQVQGGGEQSIVVRTSDGGRSWQRQLVDPNSWFYDVFFLDDRTGWVCGYEGLVLKTTDAGSTWKRQRTAVRSPLIQIQFIDKERGWAMGEDGRILRTTDGGTQWEPKRVLAKGHLRCLHFSTGSSGWVVGEEGEAYRTRDGGLKWESLATSLSSVLPKVIGSVSIARAVKFLNPRLGFICVNIVAKDGSEARNEGILLKTMDGGDSWTTAILPDDSRLIGACFVTAENIWIVAEFGQRLLHTLDGGRTWMQTRPVTDGGMPFGVYFADPNVGVVTVSYGSFLDEVLCTSDGGKTWAKGKLPSND